MLSFQPKSLRQTCFTLMSHLWAGFSAETWVLVILAPAEELGAAGRRSAVISLASVHLFLTA